MQFTTRPRRLARRAIFVIGASVLGFSALPGSPAGAVGPDFSQTLVTGFAHGGSGGLHVGSNDVTFGPIANQGLPCIVDDGVTYQNHVATFTNPSQLPAQVLDFGKVVNRGVATTEAAFADVLETSQVEDLDVLDGMITADVLKASSHTRVDATGINKFSGDDDHPGGADGSTHTTFVDLQIGGRHFGHDVAANTRVDLPGGVGYVIINEQIITGPNRTVSGKQYASGVKVNALHVFIEVPAGEFSTTADIVIAQARTSVNPQTQTIMSGQAYAARAVVGPVNVGKQGLLQLPCLGTQGTTRTRSINGVSVPALTLDFTGTASVLGKVSPGLAKAGERILDLNLLDGRITADAVTVAAQSAVQGGKVVSTTSMEFVNLVVNGNKYTIPPRNIEIPGVAKVQFGLKTCKADPGTPAASGSCTATDRGRTSITGITVTILADQPDFPLGTKIYIAYAETQLDKA